MSKVLILGAQGLLGCSLSSYLERHGIQVFRQSRKPGSEVSIDPTDSGALQRTLESIAPDAVVNLIALTDVDQCEGNTLQAYEANVRVVETFGEALRKSGHKAHFIQVSTDHLYGGTGPHPEDAVAPCNVYALSKLAGEYAALAFPCTILRTNFFGKSRCNTRTSLTDWIVKSLKAGTNITVFDDVLISALHIDTLCRAILHTIHARLPGTFNLGCSDGCSKAHLALTLAGHLGLDASLMRVGSSTSVPMRTQRPTDMRLDVRKFTASFGFELPTIDSQIFLAAQEYTNEHSTAGASH